MSDHCNTCDVLSPLVPYLNKLLDLLDHIQVESNAIAIRNPKLVVDGHNMSHIVVLGSAAATGWQKPFGVSADVKCIICEEIAHGDILCDPCRGAVMTVRNSWVANMNNAFPHLAEAVSQELMQRWVEDQLTKMEETDEDQT